MTGMMRTMIETLVMAGAVVALVVTCMLAYANDLRNRDKDEEKSNE